jgi:hypothetical protein
MALLLTPFRWMISSIIRLAIVAALLLAAYLLLLKPAIESGEKTIDHSVHSLEKAASPTRLKHCLVHADGDVKKIKRCATRF